MLGSAVALTTMLGRGEGQSALTVVSDPCTLPLSMDLPSSRPGDVQSCVTWITARASPPLVWITWPWGRWCVLRSLSSQVGVGRVCQLSGARVSVEQGAFVS